MSTESADAAAGSQEVLLPTIGAWLQHFKVVTKLDAQLAECQADPQQLRQYSDAKMSAQEQLLHPSSSRTRPVRRGAMPGYVAAILQAGIAAPELARLLVRLRCLSGLQALSSMRPAREWSTAASVAAAEAGWLEALEWCSSKRALGMDGAMECAMSAAATGKWVVLGWLVQREDYLRCSHLKSYWHDNAEGYIFTLPEQQALVELMTMAQNVEIHECSAGSISHHAARLGYLSCLQWLQDNVPTCTDSPAACWAAAASGSLATLQWLRSQKRPWPWDDMACYRAAARGHLKALQWLRSQDPPCPSAHGCLDAGKAAVAGNHFHVLEWLLTSDECSVLEVVLLAAETGCSRTFAMLVAHSCMDRIHFQPQVAVAAGKGDLHTAKLLTPYLQKHASLQATFQALLAAVHRIPFSAMTSPTTLEVIKWFWGLFTTLSPHESNALTSFITSRNSPLLIELAACSCGPWIDWTSSAHSIAAAKGDAALLRWLLHDCSFVINTKVDRGCNPGRTLLLVHGHSWTICGIAELKTHQLESAEQAYFAFYHAARWLRSQPLSSKAANLGSLPDIMLKKIACMADIDFSWTFSR